MRPISFEEHKSIELSILHYFAEYCEKNNLQYFLADGTLIGCVRHGGFIPWDDDIDIEMPRPDFEKLCKSFDKDSEDTPYRVITPQNKRSFFSFGKIIDTRTIKIESGLKYENEPLGVDIDVFILEGAPEDTETYKVHSEQVHKFLFRHMRTVGGFTGSIKHKIKYLWCRILYGKARDNLNEAIRLIQKYDYSSCKYVARYGIYGMGYRVLKELYDNYTYMKFEDYYFRVPIGYDKILRMQYKDYMKLPPPEKQVTHHSNNVYWKC